MGENSLGGTYRNLQEMWKEELGEKGEKRTEWYKKAEDYWENQEVSVNGVLGGYEVVSHTDIAASSDFLNALKALPAEKGGPCGFEYACDCGAGIGRVSKGLLLKHFQKVDLVEPCEKYLRKAKDFVQSDRAKEFICVGLQDFDPIPDRYDVIWIQWVALYLTDPDLDSFLKRCKRALKPNGVICLKENVVVGVDGKFHIDKDDNSIMRTDEHYRVLIKKAGLQLLCEMRQPKFPKGLFPVFMFAFR